MSEQIPEEITNKILRGGLTFTLRLPYLDGKTVAIRTREGFCVGTTLWLALLSQLPTDPELEAQLLERLELEDSHASFDMMHYIVDRMLEDPINVEIINQAVAN